MNAHVQQWQKDGRDLSPVGQIVQEFDPLLKEGKFTEAEAILDRAIKQLGDAEKGTAGKTPIEKTPQF